MMVKQIDLQTALELTGKGIEVMVLVPSGSDTGWTGYIPDTMQEMLEGCMFFRKEPALTVPAFEDDLTESNTPVEMSALPEEKQGPIMGPQWTVVPNGPRN